MLKIKNALATAGICLALSCSVFAAEQTAPPLALERVGTITDVDLTTSTIKIDGKPYLVSAETRVFMNNEGTQSAVSSLKDVDLHKASASYELDGKGQLTVLLISPSNIQHR